jgi:transposase
MAKKKISVDYSSEFQENAVRLTKLRGRTVASVAEELHIPAWKLRTWVADSKKKLERNSEVDELIKRDKRIAELEEQVEILKKAAAYFAKSLK